MSEGQPPREAPIPNFNALTDVAIEQLDLFEKFPRHTLDHGFDLFTARSVWNEQRQVELGRRRGRQRLIARDRG